MKKISILLFLISPILYLSCSNASKETDSNIKWVNAEKPTPIGGDDIVRKVFQDGLDEDYEKIRGANVEFILWINSDGYVDLIENVIAIKEMKLLNGSIVRDLEDIMYNIRFNYYKVEGEYKSGRLRTQYSITF